MTFPHHKSWRKYSTLSGIKCWNIYTRTTGKKKDTESQRYHQPPHLPAWHNRSACWCFGFGKGHEWLTDAVKETVGGDGGLAIQRVGCCQLLWEQELWQWASEGSQTFRGHHPSAGTWSCSSSQPYISCILCFLAIFVFRKIEHRELYIKSSKRPTSFIPRTRESSGAKRHFFPLTIEFVWLL